MAAGWVTALKLVPWSKVIEATPQIAQAAQRLMGAANRTATPASAPSPGQPQSDVVELLRARIVALEEDQRASAALIQSLAEQNAQVVRAVEMLRVRQQRLWISVGMLAAVIVGLLAWAMAQ